MNYITQYYIHVYVYISDEITCQNLTFHRGENSSSLFYIPFFAYSFPFFAYNVLLCFKTDKNIIKKINTWYKTR